MNRFAVVFLVLLRLSIGWHFLFEGLQKVHSHYIGVTTTSQPFSSAGYFREAPGPAGQGYRWLTGDADELAQGRLEVLPLSPGADPAKDGDAYKRLPPGLAEEWRGLIARYVQHYGIGANEGEALFQQHGNEAVRWLEWQPAPGLEDIRRRFGSLDTVDDKKLTGNDRPIYQEYIEYTTEQTRTFPTGELTRRMTMAERIEEYRQKLAWYRELSGPKLWVFGKDVEKDGLKAAKAEVSKLRDGLLTDLEKTQTAALLQALNNEAAKSVAVPVGDLSGLLREAKKTLDPVQKAADEAARTSKAASDLVASKAEKATPEELARREETAAANAAAQKKLAEVKAWYSALEKGLKKTSDLNTLLAPVRPSEAAKRDIKPLDLFAIQSSVAEMATNLPKQLDDANKAATAISAEELKKEALDYVTRARNFTDPIKAGVQEIKAVPALPPPPPNQLLWWMDFLTRWGLTVMGACILVGFFTRLNCWLAALFLLTTYLAVPAWPWLPVVGPSEGNYFFVNKNLVEMLALCVLGCLPTGRWFGADGLLRWMWLFFIGGGDDAEETA